MDRHYRDLFFNTVVLSFLLSALFALAAATWTQRMDPLFTWTFDFLAIFLFVYFYNLMVSLVFCVTASLCRNPVLRLILFLMTGLLALGLLAVRFESPAFFSLYTSFIVMPAVSAVRKIKRSNKLVP